MPWKPLLSTAFAICIYPFEATEPDDLPLQIGDQIYVIEQGGQAGEWFRGYLVAFPSLLAGLTADRGEQLNARVFSGVFPRNCVEIRELVDGNNGTRLSNAPRTPAALTGHDQEDAREKRKSQAQYARRMSRAVSRKRSAHDLAKKPQPSLVPDEPVPRDPNAPKPLAPVPLLRVGDDTGSSGEEPLVDEIASCLREWHDARLHEVVLAKGYVQLARVQELIKRLDTSRKQLMHKVMTLKELNTLREDTVWDLVAGNKMLGEEVIVRNPNENGRMLTADDSVIEMTKLQANMSILDRPPKPAADMNTQYHVLVDVRNLVCDYEQPATLQMYLCVKEAGEKPRPISENYAIAVPVPEGLQAPEDQPKSLFINLSAMDVGIGADTSALYIVFKLLKDEPVRQTTSWKPGHSHQTSTSSNFSIAGKHASLRGRRSVFGSQKKSANPGNHKRTTSEATTRPATASSERPDTENSTQSSDPPASKDIKMVKRTVGVGAIEIGKLARQQSEMECQVSLWTSVLATEDRSAESDDWNDIIRELACGPTSGFTRLNTVKRFDCFATAFASSDLDALVRNTPTLLHDVHTTQKLGFTGVPMQKRSDIYMTLARPSIPRHAHLAHSKFGNIPLSQRCQTNLANLQLTLEVRRGNGERIEDCIFTASNHHGHTAWRTTAVEQGEFWNQTIKLVVPADDVPGSHIVMSIADSPNFPFALAWVPLWESEAFVRDGEHEVALYVYDEYSSSIIGGKGAYLALPPWHDKSEVTHADAATLSLQTFLCSTEYSQDPNLLGLLKWRDFHGPALIELLERFSFVPEIEIVKLLKEVFAALFEILHEYADSQAYENLIFYNFVIIMGIARDRRFNLTRVIEDYATTRHDWPHASQSLLKAYQRLLTNPLDPESSRKLRATLKVGDQILKLIIQTAEQPTESSDVPTNGDGHRYPDFVQDLQHLFVAIMALMRNPMPVLLGTQTLVVQHIHSWLPELASLMAPADILEIATNLFDACAHAEGKMILYRLILLINYSHLDIFKPPGIRTTLIANTFRWLAPYWGEVDIVTEQWRSQVRLCCSVVAAQMEELGEENCQYVPKLVESYAALYKVKREPKRTFSLLFPTSLPFPSKPTPAVTYVDEAMLEMSALLAAALTTQHKLYFDANQVDITGVLTQALRVIKSILHCEAFPDSWLSLHVSHHRFGINALERISEILIDSLPDVFAPDANEAFEFDTDIWRAFFDTLFSAISSTALAMETFPEQKRRAIWKIAGDVRELGANLLKRSWEAIGWETEDDVKELHGFQRMGGYQVQFVPELIAPIVELCLSVHASLRNVAIEVLRSMIISAWEIDQDLGVIQTAMIDCLDRLCRIKAVTESYLQKTFIDEMLVQFKPLQHTVQDSLYSAVVDMFAKIEDLLGMLANVHQSGAINEATRIVDTLRLMEFLKDVQSNDVYIRYVHKLTDLQAAAGNHTEAGLALRLHADRYEWNPVNTVGEIAEPKMTAQTAFERKERLYFDMCRHFENGKCWQWALAAYKELALQYEQNVFDFSKLARTQRSMAAIHEKIAAGDRIIARYFRVTYNGLGFPISLRDKEFIFEGLPTDRLVTFEDRLQQLHPAAQILRTATLEQDVEGQYLRVFPVSAHKDLGHAVYQRTKVSMAAREYSLMSNPQNFATTTRHPANDIPITEQVVEKTIYTTAEAFPTILRRSEITRTENITLPPIQAAIERTIRKTQELLSLEKRASSGEDEAVMSRLSEDLMLSVDPNSESSVARYRSLLPASEIPDSASQEADPELMVEKEETPLDPMQTALKIALLDHALAVRRCLNLYNAPAYLATKAELVPRFEATFEHELAILFPKHAGLIGSMSPTSSLADLNEAARSTQQPAEQQASPSAQQDPKGDVPDDAGATAESQPTRGRRRSISSLILGPFSMNKPTNPANGEDRGRGRSQSRQRSRSRLADTSLSRRLSFFRSGSETKTAQLAHATEDKVGRYGSMAQATDHSGLGHAQIQQRLIHSRESGVHVTSGGEYVT